MGTYLSTNPFPHVGTRTLEQCEQAVNVGWLMAGEAFLEMRSRRLYVTTYGSGGFEIYCQQRWHMSKRHVNRMMVGYQLCLEQKNNMGPMGPNFGERHYRELSRIKTREARTAVVIEVQTRYGNNPKAEQVGEVVEEVLGKRRRGKSPYVDIRKTSYGMKLAQKNEGYFMEITHLEPDLESLIDNYGQYYDVEKVCNEIIETVARIKQEMKEEGEEDNKQK